MLARRDKEKLKWSILIIFGLWNTYEQWFRTLIPFTQWQLKPRPDLFDTLLLNSVGNAANLLGSLFIAQLIDSIGGRKAAIFGTVIVSLYQALACQIENYYVFGAFQLLLFFNHIPTIVDALIGQLVGEDGDDKERTQLLMRLTIPQSIAFAAGPFMAVQVLYLLNPTLAFSQTLCGILHLLTILPIVIYVLPEQNNEAASDRYLPSVHTYFDILSNSNLLWTLVFVMLVNGPYSAYDQVLRLHLSSHMLTQPADMSKMALLLGVTAFIVNVYVLPKLQQKLGPQQLLQLALVVLAGSYLYLSQGGSMTQNKFYLLLIGVPFQVVGTCIAVGQLSAQVLSSVPRSHMGKAAALNRMAQLAATTMTPIITGHYIDFEETTTLCYVSTAITVLAIPLVQKYGTFMRHHFVQLPTRGRTD